jgi:hypothetical protein
MPTRKTAPAVVQNVVICLGADLERDELVCRCTRSGFTPRNEIWSGPSNSVLDHVGNEHGQDHADEPA